VSHSDWQSVDITCFKREFLLQLVDKWDGVNPDDFHESAYLVSW
jgi:hypothetical protein